MKLKKWQVSVKEKSSPQQVSGANFYAGDTNGYIQVESTDEEFPIDSAKITLYNLNDRSVINESMTVKDNIVEKHIRPEIMRHAGEWLFQVAFVSEGETYYIERIRFFVGGDLLTGKEPALEIIEDWNTLRPQLESMLEDLGDLEETAQLAEIERQLAEQDRIDAEDAREQDFTQSQSQRQSAYKSAESGRNTAFNESESTRQANEDNRIQAEQRRVDNYAEIESDYAQKVTRFEEVDAKLESKANKQQEEWITPTLLSGWSHRFPTYPAGYMKDEFGFVHLRGTLSKGSGEIAFVLPEGYRPSSEINAIGSGHRSTSDVTAVKVYENGNVRFIGGVTCSVDGVYFYIGVN